MLYIIRRDGAAIGAFEGPETLGALPWFANNVFAYSMDHATKHEGYSVETAEDGIDCHNVADLLAAVATRKGINITFQFVPFSQSRNAGDKTPSLNWRATIESPRVKFTVDYMQGAGHCPGYKKAKRPTSISAADCIALECETGKHARETSWRGSNGLYYRATSKDIAPPHIGDALHSLVLDSDAADYASFEEWAADLGYASDSRSAESIYRACMETANNMRLAFGGHALEELRTIAAYN